MKKKSKKWLIQEAKLRDEGLALLARSDELKKIATENAEAMEAVDEKAFDSLPRDEKEKAVEHFFDLLKKIEDSAKQLAELDEIYDELRERVNAFYGHEVMPDFIATVEDVDEETDDADWWKK